MLNLIRIAFCSHDRALVNSFTVPSGIDIMRENKLQPTTWQKAVRKHVTDYKCSKCKHIKRLIVKTED